MYAISGNVITATVEAILFWGYSLGILDLDGVLGLGPIPVAVWAVDEGEIGFLAGLLGVVRAERAI